MPFLTLNGITLQVADFSRPPARIIGDDEGMAYSGRNLSNVQGEKFVFRVRLTPLHPKAAEFIRAVALGRGHSWSFDSDYFSGKGKGPTAEDGALQGTTKKHGAKALTLTQGDTMSYPFSSAIPDTVRHSLVMFWSYDGSAFRHWLVSTDSTVGTTGRRQSIWRDGVLSAYIEDDEYEDIAGVGLWAPYIVAGGSGVVFSTPNPDEWSDGASISAGDEIKNVASTHYFIATNNGTTGAMEPSWNTTAGATTDDNGITWKCIGPMNPIVDDVVVIPAEAPEEFVAQLYAEHSARAWQPQPFVRLSGSVLERVRYGGGGIQAVTARGREVDTKYVPLSIDGELVRAEVLEFEFTEA